MVRNNIPIGPLCDSSASVFDGDHFNPNTGFRSIRNTRSHKYSGWS